MTESQRPASGSKRYRAIKWGSRVYRRMRQKPVFRNVPLSNKWLVIIFLVILPSSYLVAFLFERTHTNYYLFTGPQGGAHYKLGSRLAEVLNQPDKMEKFLHLNIVPDFFP